nr:AraC family transcriptional regulator [Blautia pseudococcoides]
MSTWTSGLLEISLHRMFVSIVGFTVHNHVQRRRLTEGVRLLIFTDKSIMDIALSSGYETQQSFTIGFKAMFKYSPQAFRKKYEFYPFQLKFCVDGNQQLRGDMILDIKIIGHDKILLVVFTFNTRFGFSGMGKCWRKLHSYICVICFQSTLFFSRKIVC